MTGLDYLKPLVRWSVATAAAHMEKLGIHHEQRRAFWLALARLETGERWWTKWLI